MNTRFIICLGIILIIFIILNYSIGKKEKFIEEETNQVIPLVVKHTETFNIYNFLEYFLRIHQQNMDTKNKDQTKLLNYRIIGGLNDIHFRHLLNINEKIISDIDEFNPDTEIKSDSFYLISNMATFMFNNNIPRNEDEELLDINKYLIIIKNPILSNLNKDIYQVKNDSTKELNNIMIVKFTNIDDVNKSTEPAPSPSDILADPRFKVIYTSTNIENDTDEAIFKNILLNLFKLDYFKEIDNHSISVLSMLDKDKNLQEIYRYQFELEAKPTFVDNTDEVKFRTFDYKYNWSFYCTHEIVKQKHKNYFDSDTKSAFNLETFDVLQLCYNYYDVNTQDDTKMHPAAVHLIDHIDCDPIDCYPAPSECKNKHEIYQDICVKRTSEDSLYNLLLYFTNFTDLSSLRIHFLSDRIKLKPLIIYNYNDYNNEFHFFRILLFYKIFKFEKYNFAYICKISNIIDCLITLIIYQRNYDHNTIYEILDFMRTKNEQNNLVDVTSLKFKCTSPRYVNYLKNNIGRFLQHITEQSIIHIKHFTDDKLVPTLGTRRLNIKDTHYYFYKCNVERMDSYSAVSSESNVPSESPISSKNDIISESKNNSNETLINKETLELNDNNTISENVPSENDIIGKSNNNSNETLINKETLEPNDNNNNTTIENFSSDKDDNTPYEVIINIKLEMNGNIHLKVGDEEKYKLIYSVEKLTEVVAYTSKKKILKVKDELNLVVTNTEKIINTLQKIKQ